MGYATGKHALGICDLCGLQFKLNSLKTVVNNGSDTGHKACSQCWTPDHPQNFLHRVRTVDYMTLRNPRPENNTAEIRNIKWGWNPVYSLESQTQLGGVTVTVTS